MPVTGIISTAIINALYGYTPANPASYVAKDMGAGSYPIGITLWVATTGLGPATLFSPNSTAAGSYFVSVAGLALPGTWRNVGDSNSQLNVAHNVVIQRIA